MKRTYEKLNHVLCFAFCICFCKSLITNYDHHDHDFQRYNGHIIITGLYLFCFVLFCLLCLFVFIFLNEKKVAFGQIANWVAFLFRFSPLTIRKKVLPVSMVPISWRLILVGSRQSNIVSLTAYNWENWKKLDDSLHVPVIKFIGKKQLV